MSTFTPRATELPPTMADVAYGPDPRQVLDFWKASSPKPTPMVLYVHGGGWISGDKSAVDLTASVDPYLAEDISVVAINYRYIHQTILRDKSVPRPVMTAKKVARDDPPVLVPLQDAARAFQFVRSKATEWNIDASRIGLSGGSAGGCSSLWLAFHRDLAQSDSPDPVARESTRPWCVALSEPQTTLDPQQMREWTPNSRYGGHAFGFAWDPHNDQAEFDEFLAHRETVLPWINEYSPHALLTDDAPPIYLLYRHDAPAIGEVRPDPTHTANFGAILEEKAVRLGVPFEFVHAGCLDAAHPTVTDYLIWKLKAPTQGK